MNSKPYRVLAAVLLAMAALVGLPGSASAATGVASAVLGQGGSFTNGGGSVSTTGLGGASGVANDSVHHRMFVADTNSNRVVVYNLNSNNSIPDDTADYVLGQSTFTASSAALSATGMSGPTGLAYDSVNDRLYVADSGYRRVLVFNTGTITNGMAASYVLGQADFVSQASATTQTGLQKAAGVAVSANGQYVFVADSNNRRVMVWDSTSLSNGMAASYVLGQTSFTGTAFSTSQSTMLGPSGVAVDASTNRLYIAESASNRVSEYDLASLATGMNATYVMGQSSFTANTTGTSQTTMSGPTAVAAGGNRVYVVDKSNHRVVLFDATNTTNGQAAIAVYGQPDYLSSTPDNGGVTSSSLSYPGGISFDAGTYRFFVGDSGNNRVLGYNATVATPLASVTIDPSFTFTVANQATACNGESNFVSGAGTASAVAFGRLTSGANVSGGQALSVASNAGSGFSVYSRGSLAAGNLNNAGHTWADVTGTYATPAALGSGEKFGYTYKDSTGSSSVTNPGSAMFLQLTSTNAAVMGSNTSPTGSGCISFDAQSSNSTSAGTYAAIVIYTAVPSF